MKHSLSRRDFLKFSGITAAGIMLPVNYSLSRRTAASIAAAQTGSAIVTAIGTEPQGLDTCNPWGLGSALWGILNLSYDLWWDFDRSGNVQALAATDWTRPDETTVVFNIRPGIRYHGSGNELVAEDVVWSYERQIDPNLGCTGASLFAQHVESITATGTHEFTVKLKTANLLFTRIPLPPIIDPAYFETFAGTLLTQQEAGTGPWILDQWETENYISFRRNPDYWGKLPEFEEFRFQIMPEERSTVAAIRAGQLNFLPISRIENFLQLQGEANITTWARPSLEYRRLNVNHFRDTFKDPQVAEALRYGLNRQQFVDTMTQGYGQISGPVSPAVSKYALSPEELEELQPFDPERARTLLSNAGYDQTDNRLRLELLSIAGFKDFTDVAQIVQANLRDIGADVEIRIQEVGVWVDARVTGKDYDLSVNDLSMKFEPDFTFYRSDQAEQGYTGGGDPELDKLIDAANVEQDDEARVEYVKSIQRLLIEKDRELYLYSPPAFEAASNDIVGYTPWPGSVNLRIFDQEEVTITT